ATTAVAELPAVRHYRAVRVRGGGAVEPHHGAGRRRVRRGRERRRRLVVYEDRVFDRRGGRAREAVLRRHRHYVGTRRGIGVGRRGAFARGAVTERPGEAEPFVGIGACAAEADRRTDERAGGRLREACAFQGHRLHRARVGAVVPLALDVVVVGVYRLVEERASRAFATERRE